MLKRALNVIYINVLAVAYAAVLGCSFLLGAVPFSWLLGKIAVGVDLRYVGSGNPGATNLYRLAGAAWGIPALLLDAAKGWVPPTVAAALFPDVPAIGVVAGAISGRPFWPSVAGRASRPPPAFFSR